MTLNSLIQNIFSCNNQTLEDKLIFFLKIRGEDIMNIMMFYPTIGSTYFVKTRTYVALFCPHELSIIFSGVMYLELSAL